MCAAGDRAAHMYVPSPTPTHCMSGAQLTMGLSLLSHGLSGHSCRTTAVKALHMRGALCVPMMLSHMPRLKMKLLHCVLHILTSLY